MYNKKVYPVIHHRDDEHTLEQADIAFECGADGLFVISHTGKNKEVLDIASKIKLKYSDKDIGINLLGWSHVPTLRKVVDSFYTKAPLDMVWFDNSGILSGSINTNTRLLHSFKTLYPETDIFASVAFKYQEEDINPTESAKIAKLFNLLPTTSGQATGSAPNISKIQCMSEVTEGLLAVASGMSVENVEQYAPYLSHILVATGVSKDFYTFDYGLLRTFIGQVRKVEDGTNS